MKTRSHFKFRQFSVADDQCSMRVGTDAVLLGAWADLRGAARILDIGTGSGVIALIAAQRTAVNCLIDGVEIQESDCAQAKTNVAASPWTGRVCITPTAIQDYHPSFAYDTILCNPPYFINSLRSPGNGRTTARHTVSLSHGDLLSAVNRLLSDTGSASFIFPFEEGKKFRQEMEANHFWTSRQCLFRTRSAKTVERILLTFERFGSKNATIQEEELLLYAEGSQWTDEYTKLTGDFYLCGTNPL